MDLEQIEFHTVDLTKIKGRGEFRCPRCGIEISPDDKTENVYAILETIMKGGCLERLILQCNKCGCQIHVVGFELLDKV